MTISNEALIAILLMAGATFVIRAGGLLLADRLPRTGFLAAWLRHIPGAVLAALIAPTILNGGPAEIIAALATGVAFVLSRNVFAAMAAGVVCVYLLRLWL
jgi:uncharacterized membrane protein